MRRGTDWRTWSIPVIVLQVVGLVCLLVAVIMVKDGWHALGVFGFALLAIGELRAGRKVPHPP